MYNFLTEEQLEFQKMMKEFGENEIAPIALDCDHSGHMPMEAYKKAMEMGLHTLDLPEEYGGGGLSCHTTAVILEELAKFDAGFSTTVGATALATKPLLFGATEEQIKYYVGHYIPYGYASFCLTEPDAGSDVGAVRTTAVKVGDEYVINGSKCFITNGGVADIFTVFATTDKSKGHKGLSCFIVERTRQGVSVGKKEDKMGIRLSSTTDVVFEDVRIPEKNLIGNEGDGFKLAMKTLDGSRPLVGAQAVGVAQAAVDHAVKYAKERTTFGKPLASLQAIQFMLADMEIATQTARQMVYYVAKCYDAKLPFSKEAAIAKCYAGDVAMKVTTDAVQIFGGYGYSREYPVEKLMRDAKIMQIYEGTNQIQRLVIAGNMFR